MGFREVTMVETKEVLRLWLAGVRKKRIAAQLGLDPKTVRRYVRAAEGVGLRVGGGALADEHVTAVLVALRTAPARDHGEAWARCIAQRDFIERHLRDEVRLTKVRKLLLREGVEVSYATLYRFAVEILGFGRAAPTVPLADGAPGEEVQLDTGWVLRLLPDAAGLRRAVRAWIFTPVVSRYRFVYPVARETIESAIEACEAAWDFYGGVFKVIIPDNTKAIVAQADPLGARIAHAFLEYAQARGFHIDPTRVRSPRDKARVERSVRDVRDDCFGGERLGAIDEARHHALRWCETEYGMRRHSTTQRLPREHFESEEKPRLLPAPAAPYDVPLWCEPKVGRDHFAQVARALYSLPTAFIGKRLRARADRTTVRFYDGHLLVKAHGRVAPGKRAIDYADFPQHLTAYARRDVAFLENEAKKHGAAIGALACAILQGPLPWTRMRRGYALLGLVRRYGAARVEAACKDALAVEMLDVRRLARMLEHAAPAAAPAPPSKVIPLSRFARPASTYALARPATNTNPNPEEETP